MGSLRSLLRGSSKTRRVASFVTRSISFERDYRNGLLGYYFQYRGWYCKIAIRQAKIQKRSFSIILLGCQSPLKQWDVRGVLQVMHQADWMCVYTDYKRSTGQDPTEMAYPEAEDALLSLLDKFRDGSLKVRKTFESQFSVSKCRNSNLLETLFE